MPKWQGEHDAEALAAEMRRRLGASLRAPRAAVGEKRMFGGVCFLLRGNMLCGTSSEGYMFRVDPARHGEAARLPGAKPLVMNKRTMQGFFWVEPTACDGRALRRWLALAQDYVGKLPAKAARRRRAAA